MNSCLLRTYCIPGAVLNYIPYILTEFKRSCITVFDLVFSGLYTRMPVSLAGLPEVTAFHWLPLWDYRQVQLQLCAFIIVFTQLLLTLHKLNSWTILMMRKRSYGVLLILKSQVIQVLVYCHCTATNPSSLVALFTTC